MSMMQHPDLFSASELTQAVNKLPKLPFRLSGLFASRGVRTTSVGLDLRQGKVVLVEHQDRRDNPKHLAGRGSKRGIKFLECAHLPLSDTVLPDDIQDLRGFGTTEPLGPEYVINERMQTLKDSIEITKEFHRLGAVKGIIYDADGTTELHNLFQIFEVQQKKFEITFPDNVPVKRNPIMDAILAAKRHIEEKAQSLPISRIEALVGSEFYDALTGHQLIRDAWEAWQANQQNYGENDYRKRGFTYGGITWVEANESVNGRPVMEKDKASLYPIAPGIFQTFYAPANWQSTVNTVGLPYYAQMEPRKMNRGYELEVQSNPLCICTYPETLVELTAK